MAERIAFIHGYLSDNTRKDRDGNHVPDKVTRACVYAAAHLYRTGQVDKIAFSIKSDLAGPIERRLHTLLSNKLKDDDVISTDNTVTTRGEVQEIKRLLTDNDDRIISICIDPHKERVEGNMHFITLFNSSVRKRWCVKSFNEILSESTTNGTHPAFINDLHRNILNGSDSWENIFSFKKQEEGFSKLTKIPVLGPVCTYLMPELIPDNTKVQFQKWLLEKLGNKKES